MSSRTLSSGEVDILLEQVRSVESSEEEREFDESEVLPYNLANRERVVHGRMPTLELIHDRFAKLFRQTLSVHMRAPINVTVRATELVQYKDIIQNIAQPAFINIFSMQPLRGAPFLVIERTLAYTLVDLLFGGPGIPNPNLPPRDFTSIESRMIQKVLNSAFEDYEAAWKPVIPLNIKGTRTESNPNLLNVAAANETIVFTTFDVEVQEIPLTISLCLPHSILTPIRSKLNTAYHHELESRDEYTIKKLQQSVMKTPVEVKFDLGTEKISLRQFLQLKVGDTITLRQDVEKPLLGSIHDIAKFKGFQGAYHGHRAIKIEELLYDPRPANDGEGY